MPSSATFWVDHTLAKLKLTDMKRTLAITTLALNSLMGTEGAAQECGQVCTREFWRAATQQSVEEAISTIDVNATHELGNWSPLHFAVSQASPEVIAILLEAGAKLNARTQDGFVPLHLAASAGSPEVVLTLLQAGANVHARAERGYSPLQLAAMYANNGAIAALVANGADVNSRDANGMTPLHTAARFGTPETVMILLAAGSDGAAVNDDGETPFDRAAKNKLIKNTDAYWALNDARFN